MSPLSQGRLAPLRTVNYPAASSVLKKKQFEKLKRNFKKSQLAMKRNLGKSDIFDEKKEKK